MTRMYTYIDIIIYFFGHFLFYFFQFHTAKVKIFCTKLSMLRSFDVEIKAETRLKIE